MRIPAIFLLILGALLIAIGRHRIRAARRARQLNPQHPGLRTRLAGWTLTLLGFLATIAGVTLW